jgi:hypothetical protein
MPSKDTTQGSGIDVLPDVRDSRELASGSAVVFELNYVLMQERKQAKSQRCLWKL